MIKGIIFDFGGVLTYGKAELIYENLAKELGIKPEELTNLRNKHLNELMTGELKILKFIQIIKNNFKINKDIIKDYKKIYTKVMHKNLNKKMFNLAYKLKKYYIISIISNMPDLHARINRNLGLFSRFYKVTLSCDVGLMKPQSKIFELALKKLNLRPKECIFIDDRKEHLNIPKKMGFKVINFKDNKQLIKELNKFGVKI